MNRYHISKFYDCPFKRYDFLKIRFHYINRNFILCHPLFSIVAVRKNTAQNRFPRFSYHSCWGADRRRKICGHIIPVAAASQIVFSRLQTAHHYNRAWAYRRSIKKLSPALGIKLICGPGGATGKKIFTSMEGTF
jgi:hypothetical protein